MTLQETAIEPAPTAAVDAVFPAQDLALPAGPIATAVTDADSGSEPSAVFGPRRSSPFAALVPGQGGGSNCLYVGHWLDVETSTFNSIRLPLSRRSKKAATSRAQLAARRHLDRANCSTSHLK
jgi:hypothetical protein